MVMIECLGEGCGGKRTCFIDPENRIDRMASDELLQDRNRPGWILDVDGQEVVWLQSLEGLFFFGSGYEVNSQLLSCMGKGGRPIGRRRCEEKYARHCPPTLRKERSTDCGQPRGRWCRKFPRLQGPPDVRAFRFPVLR